MTQRHHRHDALARWTGALALLLVVVPALLFSAGCDSSVHELSLTEVDRSSKA